jgi:hypothetical protein
LAIGVISQYLEHVSELGMYILGKLAILPVNIEHVVDQFMELPDKTGVSYMVNCLQIEEDLKTKPRDFAEYFIFGEFKSKKSGPLPLINLPLSQGHIILNSLKIDGETSGLIYNRVITDISALLKTKNPLYQYQDVVVNLETNPQRKWNNDPPKIFLPILNKGHFSLYVINLNASPDIHIYYYNSRKRIVPTIQFKMISSWLSNSRNNIQRKRQPKSCYHTHTPNCPQQSNEIDCGIFTIINMIHPEAGEGDGDLEYQYDDQKYRGYIRDSLLKNSLNENLISICSTDENLISICSTESSSTESSVPRRKRKAPPPSHGRKRKARQS